MNIKVSITIAVIFCFMKLTSLAQISNNVKINGLVLDAKTEKPLSFSHIGITNTMEGTITNEHGEFVYVSNEALLKENIIVSHIGYKQHVIKISDMLNKTNKILLVPRPIEIEEVVVSQLNAESTVKKAISKIPDNYWKKPIILRSFYRETIKENDHYTEYAEGVIDIYKNTYSSKNEDQVRLIKGRRRKI